LRVGIGVAVFLVVELEKAVVCQPVAVVDLPKRNQWCLRAGPANGHGTRATPEHESPLDR
jgi:hypothetical protein